jgi:SAM-dependent methyltransferase
MVRTNQQNVIAHEVTGVIRGNSARSLLDIGAGNGVLAKQLAAAVGTYTAVEHSQENIDALQSLKLSVIADSFPTYVKDRYDVVLISHAVPEAAEHLRAFVSTAWHAVAPGGALLIVTFKGSHGQDVAFINTWRGTDGPADPQLYRALLDTLQQYGEPKRWTATSAFQAETRDAMRYLLTQSIRPDIERGQTQQAYDNYIERALDARAQSDGTYRQTSEHVFLLVQKSLRE